MREIQLRDAKASLSAVVDADECQRTNQISTFAFLLMTAPLEPGDLSESDTKGLRTIDF